MSVQRQWSLDSQGLLDRSNCRIFLRRYQQCLRAPSLKVTASLLAKRYAALLLAPTLSALSLQQRKLDGSVGNCRVLLRKQAAQWQLHLALKNGRASQPGGCRAQWRGQLLAQLFAGHLTPLWRLLAEISGVSTDILWENTAVRVFSLYEKKMPPAADRASQGWLQQDFGFLLSNEAAPLFACDRNPLQRFYQRVAGGGPQRLRVRHTCCYFFVVSPTRTLCSVCPKALEPVSVPPLKTETGQCCK